MWGRGFWGTAREEQWRRRKDKELEREDQIRNEEARIRQNLIRHHGNEMKSKENVLDLTRRMLSVSQTEQERKRAHVVKQEKDEEDEDEDDDRKPSAAKRPRTAIKKEEPVADEIGSTTKVKTESNAGATDLEAIRENLLGLSYAMFDSLFATQSFRAQSFCQFLLQNGESRLAEEIGLAAVEKSYGSEADVRYVLYELVPQSYVPEELVRRLTEILQNRDTKAEGKQLLVEWQVQNGDTEAAFQAALQIEDEIEKIKVAVPLLEDKPERRQQLKASCRDLCGANIIGVFSDKDWPDFLASVEIPKHKNYRWYDAPGPEVYIDYAANNMTRQDGQVVAVKVLKQLIERRLDLKGQWTDRIPGPSSARSVQHVCEILTDMRKKATEIISSSLSQINTEIFLAKDIDKNLQSLDVDAKDILAENVKPEIKLPVNECVTRHRDGLVAYKCAKCRAVLHQVALHFGLILSIHRHDLTKQDPRFRSMGIEGDVKTLLEKCGVHPDAVPGFLQDCKPEEYARQTIAQPEKATS